MYTFQVKDLFPHAGRRQQIAALSFTPIQITSSRSLVRAAALEKEEFHRYFTCQLPSVNLSLINDCDGCDMADGTIETERVQRANV
ncbi:hypothetical protein PsorP6_018159 [Peronosclerospora sorghi]|uniref:Uncharacterized protein n=1 Tax=Peronosclerospora sorghi TaxID=230839 RepID=A0ACC0WDB5_9STRA|nr:hypothetical protein PsorP6_018159 [Peronosclerospora sorghi]